MPDYQRFITYINLYEKDEKRKNVGFAKIEKRKEQCRFEIHMKNIGYTGQNSQIYFYIVREQELVCTSIGTVQIINGTADRRIMLKTDDIAGSGLGLEEIAGFVIFINEEIMLASQWKEGELSRRLFRLPGQEPIGKGTLKNDPEDAAVPEGQKKIPQSAVLLREEPQESDRKELQETNRQMQQETDRKEKQVSDRQEQQGSDRQEQPASLHVAEAAVQTSPVQSWNDTWQMMLETYPVLTPFEGEDNIRCIRVELKELRLLPRRYWYLGNNSFLLHGFFNYRYLILGQMEEQGVKRWFLGVPGVFQNQEKVMAAIFGFPEFKAEKIAKQKTNQFGYWYRFMDEQG